MENSNEALLDSCCKANVMGVDWRDNFFASLSEDDQNAIKFLQPQNRFEFGRETPVLSVEKVEFPCYLFRKKTTLVADVVERDIPLLISKPEMKERGFALNFHDDSLEADGIKYNLQTTLSGHFRTPLWYQEEINLCVNEMSEAEQIKTVKGLHRQFRYQSDKVTEDLMRRAGVTPELKQINQNVVKDCEIGNRYKKTRPRPVVSLPLARRLNEVTAMDLKVVKDGSLYFIHFIDLFTRFSRAQVIHRKTPETVVNAFITSWIASGLGAPRKLLVDNGREFDNSLCLEAMEQYNI